MLNCLCSVLRYVTLSIPLVLVLFTHSPASQHPLWDCYLCNNNLRCQKLYFHVDLGDLWTIYGRSQKISCSFCFLFF